MQLAAALSVGLVFGLTPSLPALAATPPIPTASAQRSVPVGAQAAKPVPRSVTTAQRVTTIGRRTLPAGGAGTVAVSGHKTTVGGLGLTLTARPGTAATNSAGTPAASVSLVVQPQSAAAAANLHGVIFTMARADGGAGSTSVNAAFDYSGFANAFGGDFGARLRLVELPACVLTTPSVPACQTPMAVPYRNAAGTVFSTVTVPAPRTVPATPARPTGPGATAPMVMALTSGASSGNGTYNATDLSEAYSWSAGTQGGTFTTSYPIRVPAGLGGPEPDLAVTYDSGVIDAQTISQNAQTSWLGAGWDLQTGYVEQGFRSCALDGGTTADMCDFSPNNATMIFHGSAVQLVYDGTTWHGSDDTGLKILRLTGTTGNKGDNGTYNKEYWEVVTPDGTQYYFGANYRYAGDTSPTMSTQYEPVYGNNTGEACHGSTFATSVCQQGYRWNLDYVVDTSGNSMTYKYRQDIEHVGTDNNTNVMPYVVRDNPLEIDYGQRAGTEAASPAPMRIWFNLGERCIDDVTQCAATTTDYPDTPFDLDCKSTTSCPNNETPSFWTRFRLKNIYTELWTGTGTNYRFVDTYNFGYQFPDNGDGTSPQLWLHSIDHNGYAPDGTTYLSDPQITTDGVRMSNRIDFDAANGKPEMRRWRVDHIYNGSGGDTYINYWGTPCVLADIPTDSSQNTKPCFPQTITLPDGTTDNGWFQKRWVSRVTETDLTGGSPDEQWNYTYSTAGSSSAVLWHIGTDEMAPPSSRTWSQFGGYNTVTVTHGVAGGPQTVTTSLYYRGMDNDAVLSGSTIVWNGRSVQVTDSQGVQWSDDAALQGQLIEQTRLDGSQVITSTIHTYADTLTATRAKPEPTGADVHAYMVTDVSDRTRTWLPATSTWRWTQTDTSYDGYDMATDTTDRGDLSTTADDTCTHTDYNRNLTSGITGTVAQTLTTDCAVTAPGSVATATNSFDSIALVDMNSDGKRDLVYRTSDSRIWVATNTGGTGMATFGAPVQATWSYWLWEYPNMYFADLTGDGKADIITRDTNGNLYEYVNQGNNSFGARTQIGSGFTPTGYPDIAFADLTGDGKADMQARSGDILYFWKNNGGTPVSWGTKTQVGSGNWSTYSLISLADVTGDGQADLIARQANGTLRQYTNMGTDGAGMWSTTQMYTVSGDFTAANAIAFGDMTGDGKLDIVARDTTGTLTTIADTGTLTTAAYAYAAPAATALTGAQSYYDGATVLTTAPTRGLPTLTKALATVSGQTLTWAQSGRTGYDTNGRVVDSWDAIDRNTHTAYAANASGQVVTVTVTNPMGWNTVSTVEPGHGSITSVVDPNGKTTTIGYDALGRTSKVWQNNRSSTLTPDLQYTYTLSNTAPNSVQTQTLSPTGAQIASYQIYDGRDRLRQTQTPTAVAVGGRWITDAAYDGRGLVAKTSAFYNNASAPSATLATFADSAVPTQDRYTYDNLERKTVDAFYSLNAQEWATTTAYQGDRMSVTPPTGAMPSMTLLDADGNTTELRQFTTTSLTGSYQATDYTYDRLDRLVNTADSVGNVWTSVYDPRGRVTSATDPDSGTTSTTYDDAGQVLTTTDARPVTTAFAYDNLGRPVDSYLTSVGGTHLDHWAYDTLAKGQPTSNTEYVGAAAYTTSVTGYDDAYRPLGTTVSVPSGEGSALVGPWTTAQTYNVNGSVASVTYPAAGLLASETVNNAYDANGFLLTAVGLDSYVSDSTYQPWGDLLQQTLGTGTQRVQAMVDEAADTHRVKTIYVGTEHQGAPNTWDEQLTQQYTWTGAGTLTSVDSQHGGTTTDSQCFGYDYLQRLTVAFTTTPALGGCAATPSTSTVGGTAPYWQTYTYDATGNRKTLVYHGLGGAADTTGTYSYPAAGTAKPHTLSGVTLVGPGGTVNNSYTYGAVGQLSGSVVGGVTSAYTLNNQGRVGTATIGGQTSTYLYDASGTEILRDDSTAKTLYLGGTEITTNAAGTAVTGVTRYYTAGGRTVASRNSPGALSWLAADQQGTAQIAIDQTSLAVTVRRQDPFGNVRGTVPSWPNPHGFVGGTTEPSTLVHLGARMYDPTTGRFTGDDPVTDTGDPQSLNGYAYADNNPTTKSDPSGRFTGAAIPCVDGSGGLCGAAAAPQPTGPSGQGPGSSGQGPESSGQGSGSSSTTTCRGLDCARRGGGSGSGSSGLSGASHGGVVGSGLSGASRGGRVHGDLLRGPSSSSGPDLVHCIAGLVCMIPVDRHFDCTGGQADQLCVVKMSDGVHLYSHSYVDSFGVPQAAQPVDWSLIDQGSDDWQWKVALIVSGAAIGVVGCAIIVEVCAPAAAVGAAFGGAGFVAGLIGTFATSGPSYPYQLTRGQRSFLAADSGLPLPGWLGGGYFVTFK